MLKSFAQFKSDVLSLMGVKDADICWEPIYDIVEGTDPYYEFDMRHLRTSCDLLVAAMLLSMMHKKRVVVLEPTAYYSAQAIRMFRRWQLDAPLLNIVTAGTVSLDGADAVFHHGKRFVNCESREARVVVQVFPGEDVPQDTRTLGALICASHCRDDD